MTILAQDSFQRPDQSGFGQASDGSSAYTLAQGAGTYSIVSNQGNYTGNAVTNNYLLFGTKQSTDVDFSFRFTLTADNTDFVGAVLRYDTVNNNWYRLRYGNNSLAIFRVINSVSTSLPTASFAGVAGHTYWLRCSAIGSILTVKIWADGANETTATVNSITDTVISQAGRFGFFFDVNTGTDVIKVDSLTVTDGAPISPKPRYVPRALGGTIVPDQVTQPLPYIDRGMFATIVYENRTFIPRALGGVYIPDTALWVPRAFGGTTSLTLATATTYTFTDALTADDSASTFVRVALPVDALSASDTLLATDADIPLDSLTASDIGGLFGWPVDTLTATDSLLAVEADIPLDALSASDSLLNVDGSLYTEANAASDSLGGGGTGTFTDGLSTSDSLLESETFIPLEANTASDALRSVDGYLPLDALTVSDTLLGTDPYLPLDGLTGATSPLEWDIYQPTDDALVASDSSSMTQVPPGGGPANTTYSFTDALVVSDAFLASLVDIPLDGMSVADTLVCSAGAGLIDALAASDMGGMMRGFVDALSVTDTLVQSDVYLPTEVQNVLESVVTGDSTLWVDVLSASDAFGTMNISPQPLQYINVTWVTRDMNATWVTRDGKATWTTRDDKAGWNTRDEQASWKTRDDLVTWKTRR